MSYLVAVIKKKIKYLRERTLEVALVETEHALSDIAVIQRGKYTKKIPEAGRLISHKKDIPILAAVLSVKPDCFLSGDAHFHTDKVKDVVTVMTAKEFLDKIRKK